MAAAAATLSAIVLAAAYLANTTILYLWLIAGSLSEDHAIDWREDRPDLP